MKPIVRPHVKTTKSIYENYALELLEKNPEWWGRYDRSYNVKNGKIYAKEGNKVIEKISWKLWKEISHAYFFNAKNAICRGETLRIGAGVGKIRGCRIERNMEKAWVNWAETKRQNLKDKNGNPIRIHHTSPDYCRVEWVKFGMITNESCYNFDIAAKNTRTGKGFKAEFSEALTKDPFLKYRLIYYPLYERKQKKCITHILQ
jgi:hypothetical protein